MEKISDITILFQILKGGADQLFVVDSSHTGPLIRLAERHKVVYPLLQFAQQHAGIFTSEQIAHLDNRCRQAALRSLTQLQELKRIAGVLKDSRIGYACIKGPQLSRMIYGREAIKESVDLDIMLVNSGDLMRVHELLSGMGYNRSNLNDYPGRISRKWFLIAKREVGYYNREKRCAIDLHIRPGANTYLTEKYFKGFLTSLVPYDLDGTPLPVLPNEAYFVYLCYHGALHQFSRLAWLIDIRAFLAVKKPTLDFRQVMTLARKIRAERSVLLALMLLNRYFGVDYVETHFNASLGSNRMKYLVSSCVHIAERDAGYGLTLRGRAGKVIYIMLLIKGMAGRIDWVYGILMRQVIKFLAKPQS
jgi:hypothetical protein